MLSSSIAIACGLTVALTPLIGQEQLVMIGGQALDSKPFITNLERPFWAALAATPCVQVEWQPDFANRRAFANATLPLKRRLLASTGTALESRGLLVDSHQIFRGPKYTIERVQIDGRIPNLRSFAYVIHPVALGRKSPAVVLLHGSGMHPTEAFGWQLTNAYRATERADSAAFVGSALEFAEAGYTVYVPWLADDRASDYWPRLKWTSLQRNGSTLWPRVRGLNSLYLLINEVAGGLDYLSTLPEVDTTKFATLGWGEGADLAALTGALDGRVGAVVRLSAPVDRRALRATAEGVLDDANFTHVDCALGDLETAALLAPRPLLYAYSTKDESVARIARFISEPVSDSIRHLYSALGYPNNFGIQADVKWSSANSARLRVWLDAALRASPREIPRTLFIRQPVAEADYKLNWIDTTESDRQRYAASLGTCIQLVAHPETESVQAFMESVGPFRRRVAKALGVYPQDPRSRFTIRRRTRLPRQPGYSLEFVQIQSDRTPIPLVGLLAVPDSAPNHESPVVISADGNFGLGRPFGLPRAEDQPYLNRYADALAKSGNVVFVPYFPTDFPEIAAAELQARGDDKTSYSLMISLFSSAIDFVETLPQVDQRRIGIWGISYSGTLALFTAALDQRITALVYSNPVVSVDVLFGNRDSALLAAWWPEICSTIDAVQAFLIAPRRFVRENGLRDANGYERTPLESIKRIRELFQALNIDSQFNFVRHNGGHETRPAGVHVFGQ